MKISNISKIAIIMAITLPAVGCKSSEPTPAPTGNQPVIENFSTTPASGTIDKGKNILIIGNVKNLTESECNTSNVTLTDSGTSTNNEDSPFHVSFSTQSNVCVFMDQRKGINSGTDTITYTATNGAGSSEKPVTITVNAPTTKSITAGNMSVGTREDGTQASTTSETITYTNALKTNWLKRLVSSPSCPILSTSASGVKSDTTFNIGSGTDSGSDCTYTATLSTTSTEAESGNATITDSTNTVNTKITLNVTAKTPTDTPSWDSESSMTPNPIEQGAEGVLSAIIDNASNAECNPDNLQITKNDNITLTGDPTVSFAASEKTCNIKQNFQVTPTATVNANASITISPSNFNQLSAKTFNDKIVAASNYKLTASPNNITIEKSDTDSHEITVSTDDPNSIPVSVQSSDDTIAKITSNDCSNISKTSTCKFDITAQGQPGSTVIQLTSTAANVGDSAINVQVGSSQRIYAPFIQTSSDYAKYYPSNTAGQKSGVYHTGKAWKKPPSDATPPSGSTYLGKSLTWSFVLAKTQTTCKAVFYGDQGAVSAEEVAKIRASGGNVIASFGGSNSPWLMQGCYDSNDQAKSIQQYESALEEVYTTYGIKDFDFDIEGGGIANTGWNTARGKALQQLQNKYNDVKVSLTLPVDAKTGIDVSEGAVNLKTVVSDLVNNDQVNISRVNIMDFDFGISCPYNPTGDGSYDSCIKDAMNVTAGQLKNIFKVSNGYSKLGVILMEPVDDDKDHPHAIADRPAILSYMTQKQIPFLSNWFKDDFDDANASKYTPANVAWAGDTTTPTTGTSTLNLTETSSPECNITAVQATKITDGTNSITLHSGSNTLPVGAWKLTPTIQSSPKTVKCWESSKSTKFIASLPNTNQTASVIAEKIPSLPQLSGDQVGIVANYNSESSADADTSFFQFIDANKEVIEDATTGVFQPWNEVEAGTKNRQIVMNTGDTARVNSVSFGLGAAAATCNFDPNNLPSFAADKWYSISMPSDPMTSSTCNVSQIDPNLAPPGIKAKADGHVWTSTATGACDDASGTAIASGSGSGGDGSKQDPYWASVSPNVGVKPKNCGDVYKVDFPWGGHTYVEFVDTSDVGGLEIEQAGWKKACPFVDANGSKCQKTATSTTIAGGAGAISMHSGNQDVTVTKVN